jgi:hypothetical protein
MITIGFSSHHVEALPFVRQQMEHHQVIVLEEPPSTGFSAMLRGDISISDYMMELDTSFPEFQGQLCELMRELYHEGRRIIQVEPYLEQLLQIHELFAAGKKPDDVMQVPNLSEVYKAEKRATGALIAYYARSTSAPFDIVVRAVKEFARADASRLALRERLRAKAIASLVSPGDMMYVEAGYIHYPLYPYLRNEIGGRTQVRPLFLLSPVYKKIGAKRRNLGPGDILTLHYAFHNDLQQERADLLAARSLIYIKLVQKEELLSGTSEAPHSENIVRVNNLVDRLQFHQCGELFERIRLAKTERAIELANSYVSQLNGV